MLDRIAAAGNEAQTRPRALVTQANDVPIMRPPMLAATLSPVPRRWTG